MFRGTTAKRKTAPHSYMVVRAANEQDKNALSVSANKNEAVFSMQRFMKAFKNILMAPFSWAMNDSFQSQQRSERTTKLIFGEWVPVKSVNAVAGLRLVIFLAHFIFSILLLVRLRNDLKCPRSNVWYTFTDTAISRESCEAYSMQPFLADMTSEECALTHAGHMCVKGVPNGTSVPYKMDSLTIGGSVHPIALIAIFETLTASFCLMYLADGLISTGNPTFVSSKKMILYGAFFVATVWNIVLITIILTTENVIPVNHKIYPSICIVVTFLVQYWFATQIETLGTTAENDDKKDHARICTRYGEYCQTAAILFVSVAQILSFTGASAVAVQCAAVAIFVCNVLGVTLQNAMDDTEFNSFTVIMHLLGAWLAFFVGWLPIFRVWTALNALFEDIPEASARTAIQAAFFVMLAFYLSFGFFPTAMLYLPKLLGNEERAKFGTRRLIWWGFDVLSMIVKLVIAMLVMTSDIFQPQSVGQGKSCEMPFGKPLVAQDLTDYQTCIAGLWS